MCWMRRSSDLFQDAGGFGVGFFIELARIALFFGVEEGVVAGLVFALRIRSGFEQDSEAFSVTGCCGPHERGFAQVVC